MSGKIYPPYTHIVKFPRKQYFLQHYRKGRTSKNKLQRLAMLKKVKTLQGSNVQSLWNLQLRTRQKFQKLFDITIRECQKQLTRVEGDFAE
jgi:hypothetical protein